MGRYTFYCASYWHRDCEPSSVAVSLSEDTVATALDAAIAEEREYCYNSDCGCDYETEPLTVGCPICKPDICWSGVRQETARYLFSARELLTHRRELLRGEVVWLDRS